MFILKNKKKIIINTIISVLMIGISFLLAYIVTHVLGIENYTVMTTKGEISSTTGVFFLIILLPVLFVCKYLIDDEE